LEQALGKVEKQRGEARKIRFSMCDFFDLSAHSLNFIADATTFNAKKGQKNDSSTAKAASIIR